MVVDPRSRSRTRQYALFAEDRLSLTPQLALVGGIRYDAPTVERWDLVANSIKGSAGVRLGP